MTTLGISARVTEELKVLRAAIGLRHTECAYYDDFTAAKKPLAIPRRSTTVFSN